MNTQKPVYKISIIEDDEADYFLMNDYICDIQDCSFDITWSFNYADGLKELLSNKHDIYFIDYMLGAKTGLDLLREAIANGCDSPIILLTGRGNYDVDKQAMEIGAYDYLIKGELNTEKIERCIRYTLGKSTSIKALKANEKKYRSVFEKSKDVIFIAEMDGKIKDINFAAVELMDTTVENFVGTRLCNFFLNNDHSDYFFKTLKEEGEVNDFETQFISSAGETKFCVITASVEENIEGEQYIQGIIHDITSRKKAEKSSLQIEKLAAAGRLVRTLAHEVRNPLNNISLSIEQLSPSLKDTDENMYTEIIARNTKRIGDLITELLQSSGPSEVRMEIVSLQDVMEDTLSEAIDRITLNRINVNIQHPKQPAFAKLDRSKIKMALLNIIVNAIEAMKEHGELVIKIIPGKTKHSIIIRDNGCGISEENLAKLFEPYFTSKRNGMGLGLATTLNFIQAQGGTIEVSSVLGTGTQFVIALNNAEGED